MKTIVTLISCALVLLSSIASGSTPVSRGVTEGKNHILTITPIIPTTTTTGLSADTAIESVTYYDGIGRPIQEINRGFGAFYNDIVTFRSYDAFGRESVKRLPSTGNGSGAFISLETYSSNASSLYGGDSYIYATTTFESSPLSRPLTVSGPGQIWKQNNIKTSHEYNVTYGNGERLCRKFYISGTRENHNLTSDGYYSTGKLAVLKTTDEDGRTTLVFKDSDDRIVLERCIAVNGYIDTHFIYDDYGNLCYVLSPEGTAAWEAGSHITAVDNYGYQYRYDERNRCIAKKFPGAEWIYYIYDTHDRLIFSQDGNLRTEGKWKFTLYDALGRETINGLYTGDASTLGIETIDTATEQSSEGYYGYELPAEINISGIKPSVLSYYDNYDSYIGNLTAIIPGLSYITRNGYETVCDSRTNGLLTGRLIFNEDGSSSIPHTYYYDGKGRLIQTRNTQGHTVMHAYDFIGNKIRTYETATIGTETGWVETVRSFCHNGLVEEVTITTDDNVEAHFSYSYDSLNRLISVTYGNITESYTYNIRGWNIGKVVSSAGTELLSLTTRYESPVSSSSEPQYGGNISEWEWKRGTSPAKMYSFSYDNLSRLTDCNFISGGSATDIFSEKDITYDRNGNILSMKRYGASPLSENLSFSYLGNRMTTNTYDANGNVISDAIAGNTLEWNRIGLIKKVSDSNGVLVNYSYLADGTKMSALDAEGNGLEYRGSLTFRKDGNTKKLEGIAFPGGRFVVEDNAQGSPVLVPHYYITDHLGSVRAIVNATTGQVIETSDFLAFGSRWNDTSFLTDLSNRYRYNGKEEQTEFGSPYIDYGARQYSPTTGRWLAIDPLAEKYYGVSPYAFCNNNPVNFVDPNGMDWYEDELGNAMWREGNEMNYIDETGKEWRNIGEEYLFFNGYNLYYYHQKDCDLFKAVSGRPNDDGSFSYDETRQVLASEGPIPEGFYYINPQEIQSFWYLTRIQKIAALVNKGPFPKGPIAWGFSRVWISPENVKIYDEQSGEEVIRSGFSIHGGLIPGSAGCIDLSGNSLSFFRKLWHSKSKSIRLNVSYGNKKQH